MSDSTKTNCSVAKKSTKNVLKDEPFDFAKGGVVAALNFFKTLFFSLLQLKNNMLPMKFKKYTFCINFATHIFRNKHVFQFRGFLSITVYFKVQILPKTCFSFL